MLRSARDGVIPPNPQHAEKVMNYKEEAGNPHHVCFLAANQDLPLLAKLRSVALSVTQEKLIINAEKDRLRAGDGDNKACSRKKKWYEGTVLGFTLLN